MSSAPGNLLSSIDGVLRGSPWAVETGRPARTLLTLFTLVVIFGLLYGALMGSYSGGAGIRARQMLYSASKVPLLLLVTFLISLPNFFVLNTLLGVRSDFGQALRALVATQAALTIVLAALAPFTVFWYISFEGYRPAILFNALMFAIASLGVQPLLRHHYRPLIHRNRVHRHLLRAWLVIYAFVGIQMGWVLRPFIGDPTQPTRFFRAEAWGNAYEIVAKMIWEQMTRW
jgi:hypothetical protein